MDSNRHVRLPKGLNNIHRLFETPKSFKPTNGSHWFAHILRWQIIVWLWHIAWWQFRIARCGHHGSRLHRRMFFLHIKWRRSYDLKDNILIRIKKFIRWRLIFCPLACPFWDRPSFLTNICDRVAALWDVLILRVFCHWMLTKCIIGDWKKEKCKWTC